MKGKKVVMLFQWTILILGFNLNLLFFFSGKWTGKQLLSNKKVSPMDDEDEDEIIS